MMGQSDIGRDNGWEFSKTDKKKKITDWKSVVNLKENKYKENYSWYITLEQLNQKQI